MVACRRVALTHMHINKCIYVFLEATTCLEYKRFKYVSLENVLENV